MTFSLPEPKTMIALASDHAGFKYKEQLKKDRKSVV